MKRIPILAAALWLATGALAAAPDARQAPPVGEHVQYYLSNYKLVDPKDPAMARAYAIFERVRAAADRNTKFPVPLLRIIDTEKDPWAIALPDGHIVLSKGAVEIAYRQATPEEGDARLAFVLGHELAHLAKNDYWHQQVYQALMGVPGTESLRELLEQNADVAGADKKRRLDEAKLKEWAADELGFVYAATAGYRVETLLGAPQTGQPDFFAHWMAQTQTRVDQDPAHPDTGQRANALRTRLQQVQGKLDFFHYGVRLAHFGAHEDAKYFYEEFLKSFPSREVLGNLGLTYLQLARQAMGPARAERFCFPTLLDVETRASSLDNESNFFIMRGIEPDDGLPEAAREHLKQAVDYLKQAAEMDAEYLPARLNLAVAYLYLDEIYQARAAIEDARKRAPQREDVDLIRAIVLYRDGLSTDMWPVALQELEKLTARPEAGVCGLYNLARILDDRDRAGAARATWSALAARAAELSPDQRRILCERTRQHWWQIPQCQVQAQQVQSACRGEKLPWPLPVPVGAKLTKEPNYLTGWQVQPFDWEQRGMNGHIYRNAAGTTVLDLDGYARMVALRGPTLGDATQLLARCGPPVVKQAVAGGELWSYGPGLAAWVQGGDLREIWVQPEQPVSENPATK